jgi:cytochrome c oxidase assembly factor CtaG
MTALQDQELGGIIMWIPGSMMYIIAALILIARAMRSDRNEEAPSGSASMEATAPVSGPEAKHAEPTVVKERA